MSLFPEGKHAKWACCICGYETFQWAATPSARTISPSLICGLKGCVPSRLGLTESPGTGQCIPSSQDGGGSQTRSPPLSQRACVSHFWLLSRAFGVLALQSGQLKRKQTNKIFFLVFQTSEYLGLETSIKAFFFLMCSWVLKCTNCFHILFYACAHPLRQRHPGPSPFTGEETQPSEVNWLFRNHAAGTWQGWDLEFSPL